MGRQFRLWAVAWLALAALLPEVMAQEVEWTGDTDLFAIEDGMISLAPQARGRDQAVLRRSYSLRSGESVSWEMECHYDRRPSRYNTFALDLLTLDTADGVVTYSLCPDPKGVEVQLLRTTRPTGGARREEPLLRLPMALPDQEWRKVSLRVFYDGKESMTLSVLSPEGGLRRATTAIRVDGRIDAVMSLRVSYTSSRMESVSWSEPLVRAPHPVGEELRLIRSSVRRDGSIALYLSGSVDLTKARARVNGREVSLAYGERLSVVILRPSSTETGALEIRLSGLETAEGPAPEIETTVGPLSDKSHHSLMISEIMIDPPSVGPLARVPYVEICNKSTSPIDLSRVILRYRATAYELPAVSLPPGSYAVLHSSRQTLARGRFVRVPMDHFPSMSGSFTLALEGRDGQPYDRVVVDDRLHEPGLPKEGHSLERIASDPPQWRYSTAPMGGTPGEPSLMRPYTKVAPGELVVSELMLSPESVGEKYIELYNNSSHPVELDGIYLSYRNSPTSSFSHWPLVVSPYTLPPGAFTVLTPYPPALARLYPISDRSTFVERIDFPSLSPTYSEIRLVARADREVVDQVTYRRQWLGDTTADRTKYSLERVSPKSDGTRKSSWRRASEATRGGTPGRANSASVESDPASLWPDDPRLTYKQMMALLPIYGELSTLELFTLDGQMIYRKQGREVSDLLRKLQEGRAPLPTLIVVVRVVFTHPDPDFAPLTYSGKWVHAGAM